MGGGRARGRGESRRDSVDTITRGGNSEMGLGGRDVRIDLIPHVGPRDREVNIHHNSLIDSGAGTLGEGDKGPLLGVPISPKINSCGISMVLDKFAFLNITIRKRKVVEGRVDEGGVRRGEIQQPINL